MYVPNVDIENQVGTSSTVAVGMPSESVSIFGVTTRAVTSRWLASITRDWSRDKSMSKETAPEVLAVAAPFPSNKVFVLAMIAGYLSDLECSS